MRWTVFHNPGAGGGALSREAVDDHFAGADWEYCSTDDDAYEERLRNPGGGIVVIGGDGTVGKLLLKLEDRSVPVAIWPAGTANNIACSFGIEPDTKPDISDAAAVRKPVFIGRAAGNWGERSFIESVGLGAFAAALAVKKSPQPTREKQIAAAQRNLAAMLHRAKPDTCRITLDGAAEEPEIVAVEVLNLPRSGPRLDLSPAVDPSDPRFVVATIAAGEVDDMAAWVEGGGKGIAPLTARRGLNIVLEGALGPFRIDDEVIPVEGAVAIRIERETLPCTIWLPG